MGVTRTYREITYTAPLSTPLETDAYVAGADGDWRLVVFPGTPCRKRLFHRFLSHAPPGLEVVVISRPGFGKGHTEAITDWDEQVAAIKPFLSDKKIITLGVSYGGELALKSALDFPDQVKGVVTVAALITEPRPYIRALEKLGDAPSVGALLPGQVKRVKAEIEARRTQIGPLLDRLENLTAPVEVVHGDLDNLVSRGDAHALMARLKHNPHAEFHHINGGTHYLELQYPKRLHAAVARVIDRALP